MTYIINYTITYKKYEKIWLFSNRATIISDNNKISANMSTNLPKKLLNSTESKLVQIISSYMEKSPSKIVYIDIKFLCSELRITDRHLRTVRKGISHIFTSRWRKAIKVDGIVRRNVYVFTKVGNKKDDQGGNKTVPNSDKNFPNSENHVPTSNIYIDYNNLNINLKDKDLKKSESSFLKNSKYSEPKTLADMVPLVTDEICDELRFQSGREFSNNFIMQLVLKLSKKPSIKATFSYLKGFIAYMAKSLKFEMHDAVKTANSTFRFKDNIPDEANIACNQEEIKMPEPIPLPSGAWGDVCQKLVEQYSIHTYTYWFSHLTPITSKEPNVIELRPENSFFQRWIEDKYGDTMGLVAHEMGITLKMIDYRTGETNILGEFAIIKKTKGSENGNWSTLCANIVDGLGKKFRMPGAVV